MAQALSVVNPPLPEAPCSVNVFFEISGYGRAQATGRGLTGVEAAAQLAATICATIEALAPTPPAPPALPTLGSLLECGLRRAQERGDTALGDRLMQAARIVLADGFTRNEAGTIVAVHSQTHGSGAVYKINEAGKCPCTSQARLEQGLCKHALAIAMAQRLAGE